MRIRHGLIPILIAASLAGCGSDDKISPQAADRSSGAASVNSYLHMLSEHQKPDRDTVLQWVADQTVGGKTKARDWLDRHTDAKATIGKYTVNDRGASASADARVDVSVEGEACPATGKCTKLGNTALYLVNENGEFLLRWDSAIKVLGFNRDTEK